MDEIAFINKWLHLLSIIGIIGGIGFAWMILVPAAKSGPESSGALQEMWKRFRTWLKALWIVVVLTGFYNLALVSPSVNGQYQTLLGMKMGLALLMLLAYIFIARSLPAKSGWLPVLVLLGVLIVGLSAHLNMSRISGSGLKQPLALPAIPAR
jgi:uncharacterized membrane protein